MEGVGVGLLGLGTVGSGVARLLDEQGDRIARLRGTAVPRKVGPGPRQGEGAGKVPHGARIVTDPRELLDDPDVAIVVETMGGIEPTLGIVLAALRAGKHVVTANKALLAEHGTEVFGGPEARSCGCVRGERGAGGIPIIQVLGVSLAANQVQSLRRSSTAPATSSSPR